MKVLFFTNIPSPYRVAFFDCLSQFCELTVLYERADAYDRDDSWLNKSFEGRNYRSVLLKGKKHGNDTAFCPEVINYWKDKTYDIRIVGDFATSTGMLSCAYMRTHSIPYGVECDGGFIRPDEGKMRKVVKKWLLKRAAFAFSPAKLTDEYLMHYGVNQSRIFRYPFSSLSESDLIEAKKFSMKKKECRKLLNIQENRVLISVGQVIPRKGFDVLIKALPLLPSDVGVYIIGGEPTEELKELINHYELKNVHFVPFKPKNELVYYFASADLFVLPTREDIWGLVVEEAMSFGVPVITTNKCVAGVELLEGQEMSIVESEDINMLSIAITKMLSNSGSIAGERNIEIVKEYTIEKMAECHMRAFERILSGE